MSLLDVYYRAFRQYRNETAGSTLCERDRRTILEANAENDKLESTKYLCEIKEDWIKAIEEGLVFVEKAVAEERQFIRQNGEVIPIEKVKRISKDSVEHLAKHSNLITHLPEEEDDTVVPDALYMVEKLSDYAVYENRFLYMMLCYLRDFIVFRLEKIELLRRTYIGSMALDKKIETKKRTLTIAMQIYERRTDNPFAIADAKSAAMVKRIQDCLSIVNALLATDLMEQVSKSPMIKPPIVKTNVLKMNNNFKHALALYDYIASYKGDGYTYKEIKFNFTPFEEKMGDEIAECANLAAFLAYKYGNDIEADLEREFNREEKRRRAEEAKKLQERLERLKKRAHDSQKSLEEYMLVLEESHRMMQKDCEMLPIVQQQVEALEAEVAELNRIVEESTRQIDELKKTVAEKELQIVKLNQKYIDDMAELKRHHDAELEALAEQHDAEMEELRQEMQADFAEQLSQVMEEYQLQVDEAKEETEALRVQLAEAIEDCNQKILISNQRVQEINEEKRRLIQEYEMRLKDLEARCQQQLAEQEGYFGEQIRALTEKGTFAQAELDGLRAQNGSLQANMEDTSRERFMELQAEYLAFEKYFKEQWKLTKKQIRKQTIWAKYVKPEKKKPEKQEEVQAEQVPQQEQSPMQEQAPVQEEPKQEEAPMQEQAPQPEQAQQEAPQEPTTEEGDGESGNEESKAE